MDLRLDVEFYDEEERDLLKSNYPVEYERINKIVETGFIEVPFADFKTYSQMQHRNSAIAKLESFDSIRETIGDLYGNVNVYTEFDTETGRFNSLHTNNNEQNHVSESIGCGGILSVMGAIYGLTQADWQRINIQGHRDFDFDSAVIEGFDKMLVVEAKGSIVEDNRLKTHLSNHKRSIKDKKNDEDFKDKYFQGADLVIGGITAIDDVNHAKVYLVDPPMESEMSREFRYKIKILKRLTYYLEWMIIIGKRLYPTILLKNRVRVIEKLDNITILNNISLVNSNDEPFRISDAAFESKSHIDREIIGRLHILNHRKAVFIGFSVDLYNLIADQDFEAISHYKTDSFIMKKQINLKMTLKEAERSNFIENINIQYRKPRTNLFRFIVEDAIVFQNSAGLNYSILTTENNYFIRNE
jgi:hypothetical protein